MAIDRPGKIAFADLHPQAAKMGTAEFLRRVLAALPHEAHKALTDNGPQFGNVPPQVDAWRHILDRVRDEHGIEHGFPKPAYP